MCSPGARSTRWRAWTMARMDNSAQVKAEHTSSRLTKCGELVPARSPNARIALRSVLVCCFPACWGLGWWRIWLIAWASGRTRSCEQNKKMKARHATTVACGEARSLIRCIMARQSGNVPSTKRYQWPAQRLHHAGCPRSGPACTGEVMEGVSSWKFMYLSLFVKRNLKGRRLDTTRNSVNDTLRNCLLWPTWSG